MRGTSSQHSEPATISNPALTIMFMMVGALLTASSSAGQSIVWREVGWTMDYQRLVRAKKLTNATGMTSQPHILAISGLDHLKGRNPHQKTFGRSTFLQKWTMKNVVVLGWAKRTTNVALIPAKARTTVSWVVCRDGDGTAVYLASKRMSELYASSD